MRVGVFVTGIFVGACTTAAVSSSASAPATPVPPASAPASDPAPGKTAGPGLVTAIGDAEIRDAPGGGARVMFLARGENAFVARLEMPGGGVVPEHRDTTEEYIHVLSGSGTITIDDRDYGLEAGSTVYMPANAKVSYENGPKPLVALQVFAGPEPAAKYDAWTPMPG